MMFVQCDGYAAYKTIAAIAALYAIEKTIRGASDAIRRKTRQDKSKPLVAALKTFFEQQLEASPPRRRLRFEPLGTD